MKLYWKNIEIPLGATLRVFEAGGDGLPKLWKILEIREKEGTNEYYDPHTKKSFSLKKVMKSRRLFKKRNEGGLLHIPPCTYFLVIEESPAGGGREPPIKRCFNVDYLSTLLDVKFIDRG